MQKRWICLFVENDTGVLARITGLFSGKLYNLNSLTVGPTEDTTISRMTISLLGDDQTFEQVKKQLNRMVEVIKVVDLTNTSIHMKEIMFIKISSCKEKDRQEIFRMVNVYDLHIIDYHPTTVLIESVMEEDKNNSIAALFELCFPNRVTLVRGGSVAVEAIHK